MGKKTAILTAAVLVVSALTLSSCDNGGRTDKAFYFNVEEMTTTYSVETTYTATTTTVQTTTTEESRADDFNVQWDLFSFQEIAAWEDFDSKWKAFDSESDKDKLPFMQIETEGGLYDLNIANFRGRLKEYSSYSKVQSNGGLYAFDKAGIIISTIENSDGSVTYELCDAGVLEVAMEGNAYMNPLSSESNMLGLKIGTTTDIVTSYFGDCLEQRTDENIPGATYYVLSRDGYELEIYANAGYCFYYIMTVYD